MNNVLSLSPETAERLKNTFADRKRLPSSDGDTRPRIRIDPDKQAEVNEKAIATLKAAPNLYQRGGRLVYAGGGEDPEGGSAIQVVQKGFLREELSRYASFDKWNEQEERAKSCGPPDWMVEAIQNRPEYPGIRPLDVVTPVPLLLQNDTLSPLGYDTSSRTLYRPAGLILNVPTAPTLDDAVKAVALLKDLVCDFPFATEADQSVWLASVLTPFCRSAIEGPAPLFAFDASVAGSGKTMLADIVGQIFFGRTIPKTPPTEDNEEMRKRITTKVLAGAQLILLDNLTKPLGSEALDTALTGITWNERLLGSNTEIEMPLRMSWYATGNNLSFYGDTGRRVLRCRLISKTERPEERQDFKRPDLQEYVLKNRKALIEAALTIPLAYCRAGRPDQRLSAWGSFEQWSSLLRGALVWAGATDPTKTREEARMQDAVATTLPALFKGIQDLDPTTNGVSASDLLDTLQTDPTPLRKLLRQAIVELCPGRGKPLPDPQALGRFLGRHRDRIAGGLVLRNRLTVGRTLWYVEPSK